MIYRKIKDVFSVGVYSPAMEIIASRHRVGMNNLLNN